MKSDYEIEMYLVEKMDKYIYWFTKKAIYLMGDDKEYTAEVAATLINCYISVLNKSERLICFSNLKGYMKKNRFRNWEICYIIDFGEKNIQNNFENQLKEDTDKLEYLLSHYPNYLNWEVELVVHHVNPRYLNDLEQLTIEEFSEMIKKYVEFKNKSHHK